MQYVNIEGNLCGEISVFAGAFVFRILAEGAAIIVRVEHQNKSRICKKDQKQHCLRSRKSFM